MNRERRTVIEVIAKAGRQLTKIQQYWLFTGIRQKTMKYILCTRHTFCEQQIDNSQHIEHEESENRQMTK